MDDCLLTLLLAGVPIIVVLVLLGRTVRIIPQARAAVVERLGRYQRTLTPGLTVIVPFIDRVRPLLDLREQVVSFPPQPVITEDNLLVNIDTVIYFQVTDARAATYEIANYIQGIEQLTVTTLRNVVGSMNLEETLTSRDKINGQLRGVLDEATGKWGIRVNRVELKAIEPPVSIRDSMEKQMRAERDRRAVILTAEGHKQSQILTAEGDKQAAILRAQGERESRMLQAQGQAKAIETVFAAIHAGRPDEALLSYQYLQMLPQLAQGSANKMWIVPAELGKALEGLGAAVGKMGSEAGGLSLAKRADGATQPAIATQGPDAIPTDADTARAEAEAEAAGEAARAAAAAAAADVSTMGGRRPGEPPALGAPEDR
jgi:regulator of protease activity HflC (stomatin/prohibitin superfamily)